MTLRRVGLCPLIGRLFNPARQDKAIINYESTVVVFVDGVVVVCIYCMCVLFCALNYSLC